MTVKFYKLSCPLNKATKSASDIVDSLTLSNAHIVNDSFEHIILTTSEDISGFVWANIGAPYSRKYFVTSIVKNGQIWEAHLDVDALASHYASVKTTSAIIARQQIKANPYIADDRWKISTNKKTVTKAFPNSVGDTTSLILTVLGGV